ncbi:hypothetical protein [Aureimonas sp. AU20]|uniref:hypothetical protein n=1 Tax=Aureimonas sp. AU20 TaxID=1349819 RepID=UPI00071ED02A|nr:hypothetical protein [Aureimonas sp. AU20]ALN74118.1 hypothetical protein M673_15430 [Aureimonas sp. AU20]
MLSVLVFDAEDPLELTLTLSSLVTGVVEGVLRDVVVVDPHGKDVLDVADHAGCSVRSLAELRQSAAMLKGEWVLVLRAGGRLPGNWPERAAHHIENQLREKAPRGGRFVLQVGDRAGWRRWFAARPNARLVPKAHLAKRLAAGVAIGKAAEGLPSERLRKRDD